MIRPTFASFNTALSALKINQKSMDIVGQNMSNMETPGYTRQRLDRNSIYMDTTSLAFATPTHPVGQGVKDVGVSQQRDFSLDYRYRVASSNSGSTEIELATLKDIENIFDEITRDGTGAAMSVFLEQITMLTTNPSDPIVENVIRSDAQMLVKNIKGNSDQLETIYNNQLDDLDTGIVQRLNLVTENIASLNEQIFRSNVAGSPALELHDRRNMLIDELSSYVNIEVIRHPVQTGPNHYTEHYEVLINDKDNPIQLVNGKDSVKLSVGKSATNGVTINVAGTDVDGNPTETEINSSILSGKIDGYLRLLNGTGGTGSGYADKGIPYFMGLNNAFASKFAEIMNQSNVDKDGVMHELFTSSDGNPIDASNIRISQDWLDSAGSYIVNTTKDTLGDSSGLTDNIINIISKFEEKIDFEDADGKVLFKGTLGEMLSYTSVSSSIRVSELDLMHVTAETDRYNISEARDSISSVDLNEEGVNLMTYSKSYNAAAKLMSTLDEMLDTLINRM